VTEGVSNTGRPLAPPMAFWACRAMSQRDLADLVADLRRMPPQP
jgi:hypothetical protein